jgi:predicted nucleotidyltransferase
MIPAVKKRTEELAGLCNRYHVLRLSLFGSAATGGFDPDGSDLDFVVEFAKLPPRERADAYFGLLRDLEALFGREIDLLESGPASRNPYMRRSIEETQLTVYEAA